MNPYLKKYGPGGETDPYDPTTSYIRPKKVTIDGKQMSTYSNEYRDLYNSGTVLPVYEGLPSVYAPEVEVTAEAPEWLKEKRLREQSYDPNLTDKENEKKYQAKKAIQGWMQADINQPGGLQRAGEAMTFPLKAAGTAVNLLSETLNTPLALAGEYISGRKDYGSALPNISRSMNNAGLTGFPGLDNPNPNQQITPGSAIFPNNPYAAMALDLPADLLISRGSGTLYKQGIKQGMKNIVPQLKYAVNDIITKPKKSSLEWMNEWYSSPEFLSRYSKTGKYSDEGMQEAVLEQLNNYKPKNYIDLWKDKGFKEWAKYSMDSGGLSYGVPDQVYVNRTLNPFKKGRESVRTHELTHLIEYNGHWLSKDDEKALLKPFNYNNFEEVIPDKVSFFTGPGKQYYLEPTEIHARINQARYDLNLKPTDVFTEEMFDKINKKTNWYGMGKYIKDKKSFIDLMNNFWAVAPAAIGTGAAGVGLNEMMKQQKQEYRKGGIVNPYLSYNNGGKVIVNGKEINIDSNEYRKMYESGNLMNVDKDGIPVRWSSEEAVVTAKLTDEEKKNIKKKREQEAMYNTLQAGLNAGLQDGFDNQGNPIFVPDKNGGIDAAMRSMLYEGIPELTGIPSLIRVSKDPMGHLNSALRTMDGVSTLGTMPYDSYNTPEDVSKTLDVVGAAGTVLPLAKAAKVPFFKVPKVNPNARLSYADEAINQSTKNANSQSSFLNVVDDVYIDADGNKINPKEVQRFIEDEGLKIIKEGIETPEGRRRLAEQFKKSNPKLTADEIDNLIETRIAESKASVIHNRPRHFNEVIVPSIVTDKKPFLNLNYFFNEIFPLNNAHWTSLNPSYPAVQSNLPSGAIRLARKQKPPNPFTNQEFTPGSITLGRGYEDDLAVLDHELGHATQKGGQMPLDQELIDLLRPKNIFDRYYEDWINKRIPNTKKEYKYFSKSDGRIWKNEPYPFLREARRQMIEDGILKDTYDKVTPLKLFKHFMGNNSSRIINFTPPWKYFALAKKFNEAPALVPGIISTGAAGVGINEMMQQTPQNRYGGQNPYMPTKYNNGGPVDPVDPEDEEAAMRGMMKARIAIDSHFGNPAAKRLTAPYVNPYVFSGNEKYDGVELGVPSGSTGTHFMSSMGRYAVPFIQQNKEGNLYYNENASPSDAEAMKFETEKEAEYFANENYKKVAPLMKNWGKFKTGGDTGYSTVEIERSERVYTPDGKLIMETPADAPTHEEGGVKVKLKPGSLVFPLKYFKELDAASGLPEFKKIAKTMLDNAEKAYLSGEPYSSGGKRNKERTYNA